MIFNSRPYISRDIWGLPLFVALFAVTFTLFVFLVTIYESIGQNIIPFAGIFIFLSAIFWLLDPLLKDRLSIAVANITLISIYLIAAQVLLVVSGGLDSKFFLVYYFVVFTGAISYGLSGSIGVTALVAVAYATFMKSETDFPQYIINMIVLWIIALMVGFLAETKKRSEERQVLQNLRLTALSEIARFMRELSHPRDVIEGGLEAAVRLLDAEAAAMVHQGRILFRSGTGSDDAISASSNRFEIELGAVTNDIVILRRFKPLAQDESRIMRLLVEKMQLTWLHLSDREMINAAREEKERIMDSIGSAVITVGIDGRIQTLNRSAAEILGGDPSRLIGKNVSTAPFHFPSLAEFGAESREVQIGTGGGPEKTPVEMRVIPRGEIGTHVPGTVSGWIVVFNDLKELRRLKAIIHRSEALAAVGEMAARVAHEIRNPLGGILGFLDLAERKASADVVSYLAEAKRAVRRLEGIVKDLLAFARPISGLTSKFSLSEAWSNLEREEVARQAGSSASPAAKIETLLPKLGNVQLRGDIVHFDRVMGNVLRNAREAAGPDGFVTVRVRWGDPTIWIEVDDSGPGWPTELSEKIFEPFVSTKEDGSGLGLAMTRRIIEELSGGIKCMRIADDSKRMVTRFRIAWPRSIGPSAAA